MPVFSPRAPSLAPNEITGAVAIRDGTTATQKASVSAGGEIAVDQKKIASQTVDLGAGNAGSGTQRVIVATDDPNLSTIKDEVKDAIALDDIATQDDAASPVVSPVTTNQTPASLTFSAGGTVQKILLLANAATRFGDNQYLDGTGSGKGYFLMPAYTPLELDVKGRTTLYYRLDAASGTGLLYFLLEKLT